LAQPFAISIPFLALLENKREESTVCISGAESPSVLALRAKSESPSYTAVIEWLPDSKVEVEKRADPSFNVAVPSTVVPSMKRTGSPSGSTPASESTTAVKVTSSP